MGGCRPPTPASSSSLWGAAAPQTPRLRVAYCISTIPTQKHPVHHVFPKDMVHYQYSI